MACTHVFLMYYFQLVVPLLDDLITEETILLISKEQTQLVAFEVEVFL